jgi:hypothetical protein
MTICNDCPCLHYTAWYDYRCSITQKQVENRKTFFKSGWATFVKMSGDCPLESIRMKNGEIFVPEVEDGELR